jgi:hypothetical protein
MTSTSGSARSGDVAIPKLRQGTYFPEWLLERRERAESALITVVADCYLAGVSTRRMDKLVKALGIDSAGRGHPPSCLPAALATGRSWAWCSLRVLLGASRVQSSITKTGNTHVRRLLVEAAWHHRARYVVGTTMRER